MTPTLRRTARVLPVSPQGEVLLLQDLDPAAPQVLRWGSIGGGIEPGETPEAAAVRELFEETGIVARATDLVEVAQSAHRFSYAGVDYQGQHTWFALPLPSETVVVFDHLEPEEVGTVVASGWWRAEALAGHETFVPADLPEMMSTAVAAVGGQS